MSTETENLEHKADGHRARVDSALDELRDRLSVGRIVDEIWGQVSQGQGADAMKNIGRQARDNPLALGLIGAGVAWLLAGEGVRAESRDMKRRYEAWSDDSESSAQGYAPRPSSERYRRTSPGSVDTVSQRTTPGSSSTQSRGADEPGLVDKAGTTASRVAGQASDAASHINETLAETADGAVNAARRAGQSISDNAATAAESLRDYGADVSEAAHYAADEAGRYGRYVRRDLYGRGRRLRRSFVDTLHDEPLIMGGVALAVGAAIGVSLPATRREDELLGPIRDDLRDSAYAYGENVAASASNVGEQAYEAASEAAENKGLTGNSADEDTLAEKVGDVVKAAIDTAKDKARKEGLR